MNLRGLPRYLGARLGQGLLVLVAAYTVAFVVLNALPGNAVDAISGGRPSALTPEQVAALKESFGLDLPIHSQWWLHLSSAVQGDLGRSYITGERVSTLLWEALPSTAALTALALLMAVVFGGGLAIWATLSRSRFMRNLLLGLPPLGVAIPAFWLGLMLLQVFSFGIPLFPGTGNQGFESLVLPAATLAVPTGALIASLLATSLNRALAEPFADTARAKGASEIRVQFRHALRNAVTSTVTMLGLIFGQMLGGAVVVETVFSRAGLGQLTNTAIASADIPVIQGIVIVSVLVFVGINLIVDLVYPLIDPRVLMTSQSSTMA